VFYGDKNNYCYNCTYDNEIFKEDFIKKDAFIKLRKIMSKICIIVIRINNKGELCNSRPCIECLDILKMIGIKSIYYSNDNGNIIEEKVKFMKSIHLSTMARQYLKN
jgi:hypothetical protein